MGDILHASSLLGFAVRVGQRLGIHRDGVHFHVSPWDAELRRRLWHHLLLLDTLCMETHGLEPAIAEGFSDTSLPLNANDSDWDVSPSSNLQPRKTEGYTTMTFALVQYEMAALMRIILKCKTGSTDGQESDIPVRAKLLQESWASIERSYLTALLTTDSHQSLVIETAKLTFERMRLTQMQLFAHQGGSLSADPFQPAARYVISPSPSIITNPFQSSDVCFMLWNTVSMFRLHRRNSRVRIWTGSLFVHSVGTL